MDEKALKLQGFVTPADCGGNIQAAVDTAAALDIQKVVLTGTWKLNAPLVIPGGMYLVLQDALLEGDIHTRQEENYSWRSQYITIEGSNARILGNIRIFNTHHVNISGLDMEGALTFEYCVWGRVEDMRFTGGSLKIGRGCSNFIVQGLTSDSPAYISGAVSCGKVVPGSKPDLNNIILQDSQFTTDAPAVCLGAADDCGVLNIQVDHIHAPGTAVCVGEDKNQPDHLFFNLTFTDLASPTPVLYRNQAKHVYQA